MNLLLKNPKNVYAIIVMYSFGMICVALFMEHMMNLEPCILCYMQRGSVILIGLFALLGLLINSSNLINFKLNLYLILVSAFCGIALSLRQLYLQNLPEDLVYPLEQPLYGCSEMILDDELVYFDDRYESVYNY